MNLCQQCLYYSQTYSYSSAYIAHLCLENKDRIVYVSADKLPDDCVAIKQNSILLLFGHEQHWDTFLHPSEDDSSDTEADSKNECISPEQSPVWTCIDGAAHLNNHQARSRLVTSILISWMMKLMYGYYFLVRRSID